MAVKLNLDSYLITTCGVMFQDSSSYGNFKYTRPIYESDYISKSSDSPSEDIKAYLVYKITVRNASRNSSYRDSRN